MDKRVIISFAVVLILLVSQSNALRKPSHFKHEWKTPNGKGATIPYTTYYFDQQIDHFNFQTGGTYKQRYLLNDQFLGTKNLSDTCAGPVLFYTGNEGGIVNFWDNSGFITDVLGPELGGLLVFAEHRYYGESYPFGIHSYELENVGYLTTEQALADFATLIRFLKYNSTYTAQIKDCPVIAFGGSYGGMLTAWLRMKYPTIVAGGLASSAPIGWFYGAGVPELQYVYAKIVTQDYADVSPTCSDNIHLGFQTLISLSQSSSGIEQIQEIFHLCDAPSTADQFYSFLSFVEGAFDTMAQYDYPYPATFAGDLPGWPVNVACSYITPVNTANSTALLTAVFDAISVYYNYSGTAGSCYEIGEDLDPYGGSWGYQTCTEMVMPYGSNGETDMFFPDPWNYTVFQEQCFSRWKVQPKPSWAVLQWGGLDVKASSNIFFSNGRLDPYSGGGVLQSSVPSLPALYIENSAHHLDLRAPNPDDPASIRQARDIEKSYIETWIKEFFTLQ